MSYPFVFAMLSHKGMHASFDTKLPHTQSAKTRKVARTVTLHKSLVEAN